jgi:hypothetical protein
MYTELNMNIIIVRKVSFSFGLWIFLKGKKNSLAEKRREIGCPSKSNFSVGKSNLLANLQTLHPTWPAILFLCRAYVLGWEVCKFTSKFDSKFTCEFDLPNTQKFGEIPVRIYMGYYLYLGVLCLFSTIPMLCLPVFLPRARCLNFFACRIFDLNLHVELLW